MPLISSGGIIPEAPPPIVRPRGNSYGPGVTARFQKGAPGTGRAVLENLQSQPTGPAVSLDDISASGLQGRVRAKRQLDELYEGQGGYDPKLAELEEGSKDLAMGEQEHAQALQRPDSGPRPPRRWQDRLAEEQQQQGRVRLQGELDTIAGKQKEMEEQLLAEVMLSPEYATADPETQRQLTSTAQARAQQHAMDLERRILAVGSLGAGKGLPTTAFPRP